MNKKFIIAGVMFWASLSGYMGLRVLESYTEDAVYAVLSVIPAQAQEIRYSLRYNRTPRHYRICGGQELRTQDHVCEAQYASLRC